MKISVLLVVALLPGFALGSPDNKPAENPAVVRPISFGMSSAQALADAERQLRYGSCGMCVFKERIGKIWVFRAFVGYAGRPAPDIYVVEPKEVSSVSKEEFTLKPNQPLVPTPGSAAPDSSASQPGAAHL